MTTYWCNWCGATAEAISADEIIPCRRCSKEFYRLFGFWPRTDMTPLADGEEPGEPMAARKSFTFVNVETGVIMGSTEVAPAHATRPRSRRRTGASRAG
jgi:hypothetical protein